MFYIVYKIDKTICQFREWQDINEHIDPEHFNYQPIQLCRLANILNDEYNYDYCYKYAPLFVNQREGEWSSPMNVDFDIEGFCKALNEIYNSTFYDSTFDRTYRRKTLFSGLTIILCKQASMKERILWPPKPS
ncbi:MAG: hypothetical protein WCK96_07555 [Methylococcales bacterium]